MFDPFQDMFSAYLVSICIHAYSTSLSRETVGRESSRNMRPREVDAKVVPQCRIRSQIPLIVRELIWMFWHAIIILCDCFKNVRFLAWEVGRFILLFCTISLHWLWVEHFSAVIPTFVHSFNSIPFLYLVACAPETMKHEVDKSHVQNHTQ